MDGWIWRTDVDLGLGGLWDPVLGTTEVRKISSWMKHRSMGKKQTRRTVYFDKYRTYTVPRLRQAAIVL